MLLYKSHIKLLFFKLLRLKTAHATNMNHI